MRDLRPLLWVVAYLLAEFVAALWLASLVGWV